MLTALQGLLPLIVFALVDIFAGMRAAIIAAIFVAIGEVAWSWYQFGEVDNITWLSVGLVLVMGLVSIVMKDPLLFKFQPVVLAFILAAVLSWFEWQGQPLIVQMVPKIAPLLPEDQRWVASDPEFLKKMARFDLMIIPTLMVHAVIVAWAALRKSTLFWLVARGVGLYAIVFIVSLANFVIPVK